MATAKLAKELNITTPDKIGVLEELTKIIASQGTNIEALCAYGMEGKAVFYVVTNNNAKIKNAIATKGWQVKEIDVVMVDLENKPGALSELAAKLKSKNINLKYCYGSACTSTCPCRLVLNADNSNELLAALK
ncbi:MAG: hypothetical protein FJZ10_02980 [Candidatus Omnitrophica bacterium]|nr:hypothetical protein [Candidatus Omnitrophota bacterium]